MSGEKPKNGWKRWNRLDNEKRPNQVFENQLIFATMFERRLFIRAAVFL